MDFLKKLWAFFDGKKRNIAHFYWLIWVPCMVVVWPTGVPVEVMKVSACIGIALSAIGYGHAAFKANEENKEAK